MGNNRGRPRSLAGFVSLVGVVAILVAGCGGSGAVTAPNTPKQIAADKALAKQAVLTAADLPAGYTGTPHDTSSDENPPAAVERAFVACSGIPKRFLDTANDSQPNASSPDFSSGQIGQGPASEVDSSIELDRSSKDISVPLSHLAGAAKCFEPLFRALFAQGSSTSSGVSFGAVTVEPLAVGSVGDQSAAVAGHFTISGNGVSITTDFDLYFVRTGRAIVMMTAAGFDAPVDQPLAKSLLQKMVGRLKAAT